MKPVEQITYNKNTGKGVYAIYWNRSDVRISFSVSEMDKTRVDRVRENIIKARKRAYAMYFAEENRDAFHNFISYVATWYEPSALMMETESFRTEKNIKREGREVTKKDVMNGALKYFESNTKARGLSLPDFAIDINEFCNGLNLKEGE